jgi:hypothetical protein
MQVMDLFGPSKVGQDPQLDLMVKLGPKPERQLTKLLPLLA